MKKLLISAVLLVSLTACHTTGTTAAAVTTQDVAVTSAPKGAACHLKNSAGSAHIDATPGSASVTQASDNLLVSCKKDGAKGSVSVAAKDGAYPATLHIVVK